MKIFKRTCSAIIVLCLLLSVSTGCDNNKEPDKGGSSSLQSVSGAEGFDVNLGVDANSSDSIGDTTVSNDSTPSGNNSGKQTSSATKSSTASKNTTSGNTQSNSQSFVEDAVFTENVKDLKGVTIKIATPWSEWGLNANSSARQKRIMKHLSDIEKEYNCKIQQVPFTQPQQIILEYSAGRVFADIIEDQQWLALYSNYMEPVTNIKSLGMGKNEWDTAIGNSTMLKGKQYGVGFMMEQNLAISQRIIAFNKKIAKDNGMGDFYALVRDKKWTLDKFLELSKSIYNKTNGKIKGLTLQHVSVMSELVAAYGVNWVSKGKDGKYHFNANDERTLQALKFWQDYRKNKYALDTDNLTGYGEKQADEFMAGKSLFFAMDYIGTSTWLNGKMRDDYGILPLPMAPGQNSYPNVYSTKFFSFIKDNPNMEAAGSVLTAIANRTKWKMEDWDNAQMESAIRDKQSLEMMHIITGRDAGIKPINISTAQAFLGLTDNFYTQIIDITKKPEKTPAQALQEISGQQEASVQVILN